jgi:hypothetical protein
MAGPTRKSDATGHYRVVRSTRRFMGHLIFLEDDLPLSMRPRLH